MTPTVGQVIADKFEIEAILGRGGMGTVVRARHLALDERVAIKFINTASDDATRRFLREARSSTRIKSEHVARVLDVATLPSGDPYMVMECLEGEDLDRYLERLGPLPMAVAVELVLQACEAIAEAHALGIVHRDLKPANLFVTRRADGTDLVKVLDFGISKATPTTASGTTAPDAAFTQTSALMGSPLYMSPEQMRDARSVSASADIWALGVIFFQLVSGRYPFEGDTMPELCAKILVEPPVPLGSLRPDLPVGFVEVVHRCLAKDPPARWRSVGALAASLRPYAPSSAVISIDRIERIERASVPDLLVAAGPISATDPTAVRSRSLTNSTFSRTRGDRAGDRTLVYGAAALGILLLSGAIAGLTLSARSSAGGNVPPSTADTPAPLPVAPPLVAPPLDPLVAAPPPATTEVPAVDAGKPRVTGAPAKVKPRKYGGRE